MSRHRLTVVLSQAPGKHPAKRALEEALAAALVLEPSLDASIVPNLYDLGPDHTGRLFLESVHGDMVVLSWHFPRAAFWLLDRDGIQGHFGESQLKPPADANDEDEEEEAPEPPKGIGASGDVPDRHIYCLDLRDFNTAEPYLNEIRRIATECGERHDRQEAAAKPATIVPLGLPTSTDGTVKGQPGPAMAAFAPEALLAAPNRRWYP